MSENKIDENKTMIQFFHWYYPEERCLWIDLTSEAGSLKKYGLDAVWMPPACKARQKNSSGYDIYDLYDLGEFDQKGSVNTRYGSKEEYLKAIQTLHENGLEAYADLILNHKAGADEKEEVKAFKVDPDNRNRKISDPYQIEAYTKFTFPGRQNAYSDFKWNYNCFTGVDWDDKKKEEGIFKLMNQYGTEWGDVTTDQKGNFDFLMFADLEFRNEDLREELLKWGLWYIKTSDVDGFRLDAVKHMPVPFFKNWLTELREKSGKSLFTVGELADKLEVLLKNLEASEGVMSLFDFPLHRKFKKASQESENFDLRTIFDDTLVVNKPELSVTFLDNHDTQPLRERASFIEAWFRPLAYALILLREGDYPCVFYPDLYGAKYTQKREEDEEKKAEIAPCSGLKSMLKVRKEKAYGKQRDFFSNPHIIG